jgi:hypothetical protein
MTSSVSVAIKAQSVFVARPATSGRALALNAADRGRAGFSCSKRVASGEACFPNRRAEEARGQQLAHDLPAASRSRAREVRAGWLDRGTTECAWLRCA